MRALAAALASVSIFAAACDSSTPARHVVTAANPVRSASELRCSLPIVSANHVGFVDFPSGRFRDDPSAPTDYKFGLAYAFGAHTWVKTFYGFGFQLISPDGRQLAQVLPNQPGGPPTLELLDVSTNTARRFDNVPPGRVLGFLPDGLYVAGAAIYRVDVASGHMSAITPKGSQSDFHGGWFWVTTAAAWFSLIAGPNQGDRNTIRSISLKDGSLTDWYTAPPARSVSIIGFVTPSEPLIVEYNTEPYDRMTGVSFMLMPEPGVTRPMNIDPSIEAWAVTDSMGLWLESPGHVWLYSGSKLIPMADVSSSLGTDVPGIAGPCR